MSYAGFLALLVAGGLVTWRPAVAAEAPVRAAEQSVNDAELRTTAGLTPNTNLLFNGWGVTLIIYG